MPHSRLAAPALFAALAVSCGRGPREPQPAPGPPAADLLALPLSPGLILALDPNLPGVDGEDLPESTRREVEVLEFGKGGLRLRWSGRVRIEKPDSSRRREEWVRARANAPQGATPVAALSLAYREVLILREQEELSYKEIAEMLGSAQLSGSHCCSAQWFLAYC